MLARIQITKPDPETPKANILQTVYPHNIDTKRQQFNIRNGSIKRSQKRTHKISQMTPGEHSSKL